METRLDHRRSACSNFINKVRSRPGATPQLGFWGHIWQFVFGSLFTSLGLMGGELFRRFTQPNMLFADGAQEMFKKKLFWKVGPQLIGGVVGYIAAGGFLQNVLGYYVG